MTSKKGEQRVETAVQQHDSEVLRNQYARTIHGSLYNDCDPTVVARQNLERRYSLQDFCVMPPQTSHVCPVMPASASMNMYHMVGVPQMNIGNHGMPPHVDRRFSLGVLASQPAHGSSSVAIDNKIEQAMDLVKSHLMFAVREEVEVLKEQIAELIERNNQLEYENSILRAAASPETLAKLAMPRQPPSSSS